jgi:asparagine synthase (glutamine-hydrolysing)
VCGIAGTLSLTPPDRPASDDLVARMCATLRHRGPDDEGRYVRGPVALGMTRLAIIDLTTGHQPLSNEDGSVWTVFNGEIYNFRALRAEVAARGHRLSTKTDTEVIVHLYEDLGPDFVRKLAGMFALALWDERRRRLVVARDRLGIKPLYYTTEGGRLVFGSELKAVLAAGVSREIDRQALHDYLSLGYIPAPRTIFRAVKKLPPAHLMVATAETQAIERYWSVPYGDTPDRRRSDASYAEELRTLLRAVTAEHLESDVPLGVFLSGGLDSATLVALVREVGSGPLRTFSIGFAEPSYDELADARRISRRFDTEHHEMVVRPDAVDLLPKLVEAFDEPFADSSAVPVFCLAGMARRHVTVALSGEGGDEVFAGYHTYVAWRLAELYKRLPEPLRRTVIPALVARLPVSHARVSFDYRAKRFVHGALAAPADAHYAWKVLLGEREKASLYGDADLLFDDPGQLYRDAFAACGATETLTRLQAIDLGVWLPDDILVKADRMTMAHSLEGRVPFVDHRVVEFAMALPARLRLHRLTKKYVLRRAMADVLPAQTLRGRKRGFNVPIPAWLAGDLRELMHDVLGAKRMREWGFFDPARVRELIEDHEQRRADRSRPLWALLVFTLWCETYLRAPVVGAPVSSAPGVGAVRTEEAA